MLLQTNGLTAAEQDRCLEVLQEEIEAYRRWAPRRWGQLGHDALDEALAFVWLQLQQGRYDSARGEFRLWCRQVLQRLLFGHGRRARRLAQRGLRAVGDDDADGRGWLPAREDFDTTIRRRELADFAHTPFSGDDVRRIARWPMLDRVVLLGLAGLADKLPRPVWQRWWNVVAQTPWQAATLPAVLLDAHATPQQRLPALAAVLRVKANTLAARWMRSKHRLAELDCIQDLGIPPAELAKRQPRRTRPAPLTC